MTEEQAGVCAQEGVTPVAALPNDIVGVARNVRDGIEPINGLRHRPENGASGWYIWAGGEPSQDPNFFQPLHVSHLEEWCPVVLKFLALPPGWRVLVSSEQEEIWWDPTLLDP